MKRYAACTFILAALFFAPLCEARINLFEPWHPGQDSEIGPLYSYEARGAALIAEHRLELPASFTYISHPRLEVGGRWGLLMQDGKAGINDLQLGLKYQFLRKRGEQPAVIGEAGVLLPTADSSRGLGYGAPALLLHWAIEKDISDVTGYFGIGAQLNSENSAEDRAGNIFFFHAGAGYTWRDDLRFYGELKGFNHGVASVKGNRIDGSDYQELYLAPGVDYAIDRRWTVSSSLLIGLTSESNDIGFIASTRF